MGDQLLIMKLFIFSLLSGLLIVPTLGCFGGGGGGGCHQCCNLLAANPGGFVVCPSCSNFQASCARCTTCCGMADRPATCNGCPGYSTTFCPQNLGSLKSGI